LELLAFRQKEYRRERRLMNLLQFISTQVWKSLFGKAADSLERSIDHADEFMIVDYSPITRYVVVCLCLTAGKAFWVDGALMRMPRFFCNGFANNNYFNATF
jgi:hypothetical protein